MKKIDDNMIGFTFYHKFDKNAPEIIFNLHSEQTLEEIIGEFELFLKASGFNWDKNLHLDFVSSNPTKLDVA